MFLKYFGEFIYYFGVFVLALTYFIGMFVFVHFYSGSISLAVFTAIKIWIISILFGLSLTGIGLYLTKY